MSQPEPEEIARSIRELDEAAETVRTDGRTIIDSGSTLGPQVTRTVAALRDFAEELTTLKQGVAGSD